MRKIPLSGKYVTTRKLKTWTYQNLRIEELFVNTVRDKLGPGEDIPPNSRSRNILNESKG